MTIWNGLTSDGAVVPIQVDDQGRVIAVGSGPDSPIVVDGDYLRPRDATKGLATANINLDADGSAGFGGGNGLTTDHSVGIRAEGTGLLDLRRDDNNQAIGIYNGGDSSENRTVAIFGDGQARFASQITSEGRVVPTYQQGLWTPTVNAGSIAFFNNTWERIGDQVTIRAQINGFTTLSESTIYVGSVPYELTSGLECVGVAVCTKFNNASTACRAKYESGITQVTFLTNSVGGSNPWTALQYADRYNDASSGVFFQVTYRTNDTTWAPANAAFVSDLPGRPFFGSGLSPDASTMPSPEPTTPSPEPR